MSFSGLATPQGRRNTILASVAVAALGVAGVLGGNAVSPTHPAYAAPVSIADSVDARNAGVTIADSCHQLNHWQ